MSEALKQEQWKAELAAQRDLARRLGVEIRVLRRQLEEVYQSPAWRISSHYRQWLRRIQIRHPLLHRMWAWCANRAVRWIAAGPEAAPPAPGRPIPEVDSLAYQEWIAEVEPSPEELELQEDIAANLGWRPTISILLPVFRVPHRILHAAVESVLGQTYGDWELCIAHGEPDDVEAREYLASLAGQEARVKLKLLEANLGISGNTNQALELATGEFIALLDHDDTLAPFALYEVAQALNEHPDADFLYSDKDHLTEDGRRRYWPFFKPGWSPHLMLSADYVTHLCVIRAGLARRVGGFRSDLDGAQDWDFFLRVIGQSRRVTHIPKVLYHWRVTPSSAASGMEAKPYAAEAQRRCLDEYLKSRGWSARARDIGDGTIRLEWDKSKLPPASVIVVIRDGGPSATKALGELARKLGRKGVEVVAAFSGVDADAAPAVKKVRGGSGEGLAEVLNRAAQEASGEVLVFFDPELEGEEGWLDELLGPFEDPALGAVGAKLLDPCTGRIRHMGVVFNGAGEAANLFEDMPEGLSEPFGGDRWLRDVLAVSGACLAVRRSAFLEAGGFGKTDTYPRLDLDLCLRIRLKCGLGVVVNPFARLWQTKTAALEERTGGWDARLARERFLMLFPEGDPFFNPNLEQRRGSLQLRRPSRADEAAHEDLVFPVNAPLAFDFTAADLDRSREACAGPPLGEFKTLVWFTPEFPEAQYGGVYTILRFADYFRRAHGVRSAFVFQPPADSWLMRERIRATFPALAEHCEVVVAEPPLGLERLGPADAGIATEWRTAYRLLRYNQVRRKFYFVQDDESLFHAAGPESALADESYRFGFLGICNSVGVRDRYALRGGVCKHFDPCVDTELFYPAGGEKRTGEKKVWTVFWYARPSYPRNCFEILADAVRLLKQRLRDRVRIVSAGEAWDPASRGLEGVVENLGLLTYRQTAAVYRSCDAGVVSMMTCHPSYIPLELMASGALVVSNRNPHTAWLLQDRVNSLVSECSASCLADALEEGLTDSELRARLTSAALSLVRERYSRWDEQAEKVYRFMCTH